MTTPCPNPACQAQLSASDESRGTMVTCPSCLTRFMVPGMLTAPPKSFVIYDLETTGLSANDCEIIQIAAVRFKNGRVVSDESFATFCRPSRNIPSMITRLTGISDHDVRTAPSPAEALLGFSRFVGGSTIMAHNGHRFDLKFLENAITRYQLQSKSVDSIDTMSFSRKAFGTTTGTGHSLDRVLSRLGINPGNYARHDARGDVLALGDAVSLLWQRLGYAEDCPDIQTKKALIPT